MNPLGLVPTGSIVAPATTATSLQLRLDNILTSGHRLWLRGRLLGLPDRAPKARRWWPTRPGKEDTPPPLTAHLETHVSGQVLQADVMLGPSGVFETVWTADLPSARRGWRVARNRVIFAGQSIEGCGVVTEVPDDASVVVVLLPRGATLTPDGLQQLQPSPVTDRLKAHLHPGCQGLRHTHFVVYVACVPSGADASPAELALAIAALGWPPGTHLLLPTDPQGADAVLAATVDRLRWLFAGRSPLRLVNLDLALRTLDHWIVPVEDRADVRCTTHSLDGPAAADAPHAYRGPAQLRPSRGRLLTRHPLVFCHGMLACTMLRMQLSRSCNYFAAMSDYLQQRGFRVLFPQVTPTGGVAERAEQLRAQVRSWTDAPVNLIAHSMGGLDCRHLITHLGMAAQVRSLTTVSTPHHGTYAAEWFSANYRRRVPLLLALEALGVNVDGFRDCQPAVCRVFNARTPDVAGVQYFSYNSEVCQARVSPILRRLWALMRQAEGPNDGMVSTASARWGELLGTIHADHFAQTPDGLFVRPGERFDSLGFFLGLIDDLARRGL